METTAGGWALLLQAVAAAGEPEEEEQNRGFMAITAQTIIGRIQQNLTPGWKDNAVDSFVAGSPDI